MKFKNQKSNTLWRNLFLAIFFGVLCFTAAKNAVRDCNNGESNCDIKNAPYTCLEEFAKGGCNGSAEFWPSKGCNNQCKRVNNPRPQPNPTPKPNPQPNPAPRPNPQPNPSPKSNVRDCNNGESYCDIKNAPYTCLEESAKGGCNGSADFWPSNGCNNQCKRVNNPSPQPSPSPNPNPQPNPSPKPNPQPNPSPKPNPRDPNANYYMSDFFIIKINKPNNIDFRSVMNQNNYIYPEKFSNEAINSINNWANDLLRTNPFSGLGPNEIPYINLGDTENKDKKYAFITQEQMAYIFLISIFGNGVEPFSDGQKDGLNFIRNYNDGGENTFMFAILCFLNKIKENNDYKTTYLGIAFGGMSQEEGMNYIFEKNLLTKRMGQLNVCYFDEGKKLVNDNNLDDSWCRSETQFNTMDEFFKLDKKTADLGGSFHSVDIPGQTIVDIGGLVYGGGIAAPGAHIANSQDESLPLFFPETIGWSFFKVTNKQNPNGAKISFPKGIIFFGVRRYVHGFNGSKRVLGPLAGKPLGPAREYLTNKVAFIIQGKTLSMYDHSMTFLASQMSGDTEFKQGYWTKKRKLYTQGMWFGSNKWNNLLNQNQYGWSSPLTDIGKWYGCFEPNSYNSEVRDAMTKTIRRIGTFNWGAGVWWGDPQQYFLISWLGTSMLNNVMLDYYIFSTSIENEGVQISLLKEPQFSNAVAKNKNSIIPGQWLPPRSPNKDVRDVYQILKNLNVSDALQKVKQASNQDVFVFDGM